VPSHFRALEQKGNSNRKDEILLAAVSAFVALSRPNKRDCNQIEDLAHPILPFASEPTKRFICAALAENPHAPANLLRRLCDEPVETCAPLLLLSPVLSAIDMVSVIGRKGKDHARIIARRSHLPNDVIEALALVDDERARGRAAGVASDLPAAAAQTQNLKPKTAIEARELLAELALSLQTGIDKHVGDTEDEAAWASKADHAKLVRLALHEGTVLFSTALADATGVSHGRVQRLLRRSESGELLTMLKAINVRVDTAFVIACALNPQVSADKIEIKLFMDRFEQLDQSKAVETIRRWKADEISVEFKRRAVNSDREPAAEATFRAS
jgi:uncharacterized protein (DUF2336 family)